VFAKRQSYVNELSILQVQSCKKIQKYSSSSQIQMYANDNTISALYGTGLELISGFCYMF